jgi:hypothetical protein
VKGDTGAAGPQGPAGAGVPTPVVNGQWVKGVGGAAVWAAITPADVGLPKITSSAYASGPPGSPADGDIWIGLAAGGSGQNWMFRYAAGSSSAYKWEFLGGPEVATHTRQNNMGGSVWTPICGSLAVTRPGDYTLRGGMWGANASSGASTHEIGFGNTLTTVLATIAETSVANASYAFTLSGDWYAQGLATTSQLWLNGWSNAGSGAVPVTFAYMSIVPVRIS